MEDQPHRRDGPLRHLPEPVGDPQDGSLLTSGPVRYLSRAVVGRAELAVPATKAEIAPSSTEETAEHGQDDAHDRGARTRADYPPRC